MPIPYMGSKRKSAQKICQTIINFTPEFDKSKHRVLDLFCGGWAISEYFYKRNYNILSNDMNKYVIALLKETTGKGLSGRVYEFVTRSRFLDVIKNPDKYEAWYVGYVMCIWSFGNNQKGYLFGKETEPFKKAGHELVVNKDCSLIRKTILNIPEKYIKGILKQDTIGKRRIALAKVSRALKTRIFELQQLERLQQLEQLEQLELINGSYLDVKIKKGDVIYCDPPYKGTAEYHIKFNHSEFWDWVRKVSKTNKVFVSEYTAPNDFKSILSFPQKSTLQGGNQTHNNQPNEKLFICNS